MGDLISINNELLRLSKTLAKAVNDFEDASIEAAELRSAFDVKWAQSLLKFRFEDGTEAIKKAMATEVCQHEMTATRIKEAMRDALKERIRALQTVISTQQSRLRYMEDTERTSWGSPLEQQLKDSIEIARRRKNA
jgi:hypothetical protein